MRTKCSQVFGFSLVEVVIALGLFSFCIVAITGLLSVGLGSTRSVVNEGVAVNIAGSVYGAWDAQREPRQPLRITNLFTTNLPSLLSTSTGTNYFDANGLQVPRQEAALEMVYSIDGRETNQTVISTVQLEFRWPPGAPTNSVQTRSFSRVFVK
jgi:uncharacterized protein (TIGR02598 family)